MKHRFLSIVLGLALACAAPFLSGCPEQNQPTAAREEKAPAAAAPIAPAQAYAVPVVAAAPAPVATWQPIAGKSVILDAGHGGNDLGAAHFGLQEKDINLDLVLRTAALLRAQGVTVHLTRQSDVFVPLPQRSAFANRYPNAVLVSVHVNASASNPNAFGVETFVLSGEFKDADRGRTAASRYKIAGSTDPNQGKQAVANLAARCRNQGPGLAKSIQSSLTGRLGEPNRGVKPGNLAVLRETYFCPAVLVEVGFITHAGTATRMRTDEWRRRVSEGLAAGIADFLRQPQ